MQNSIDFFYKMLILWNSEIIKAIPGTVKSGGIGLCLYASVS